MKITVRLDKRYKHNDGKYSVKIAIARNGSTLYVPTGIDIEEKYWEKDAQNMEFIKTLPNRKAQNLFLRSFHAKIEQKIRDLQLRGELRSLSNKALLSVLMDKSNAEKNNTFKYYAEKFISEKKNAGTKQVYTTAVKAFGRHFDYDTFRIDNIDSKCITKFIRGLENEGLKVNTIDNYISQLRIMYRYAISQGAAVMPFPPVKIKRMETAKRSLLIEQIRALHNCTVTKKQRIYIDMFFLILYMRGINIVDLSSLPSDADKNGHITYVRQKTKKHYDIKLEPEISEIINRYRGKEKLIAFFEKGSYKVFSTNMKNSLRTAAKKIGISEPLSAYWARHSWATLAVEVGGSMEIVSAGLGHSFGVPVTNVYVAFRQRQIDELARKVIDYVNNKN